MLFESPILLIVIAGLMNGSFVIPARYITHYTNEKIWLYHSVIGLLIIPWLLLAFIFPNAIYSYFSLPFGIWMFLIFSGAVFGLGQLCFSYAIKSIGIALSFTINLSIGVIIGSMFVVFYKKAFFTTQGYLVTLAILLILSSLLIYYFSGKNRNIQTNTIHQNNLHYHTGWMLAFLTGLTSGLQNITFIMVTFHAETLFKTGNSFWVWPPFLLAAAIPMLLGFLHRLRKNQIRAFAFTTEKTLAIKNIFLVIVMGLFFTGSLALYSNGMHQLNHQQQIIGWPAFMVSIILASQLWGWLHRETSDATAKNKRNICCSVLLLIIAIMILALAV